MTATVRTPMALQSRRERALKPVRTIPTKTVATKSERITIMFSPTVTEKPLVFRQPTRFGFCTLMQAQSCTGT